MEFKTDKIQQFLDNFESVKEKIRTYPGCLHLELYRDKQQQHIFFTYSKWKEESELENYRNSALFKEVWSETKSMFLNKATAWSVDVLYQLD